MKLIFTLIVKLRILFLLIFICGVIQNNSALCQVFKDSIYAFKTNERIVIDGILNEDVWHKARKIKDFTQCEPNEGAPGTEPTHVAIAYDDYAIYVAAWCYISEPDKIQAKYFQRDFDWWKDDNFQFALDTYNDKRNGYLFVINANGARADAQITDEGNGFNTDWNGVWDVATNIDTKGWTAEFIIPFSTLQFKEDSVQIWGINFERNIRFKNEQQLWQGWQRNYDINKVSQAGLLAGLKNIKSQNTIEFKPYLLMGYEKKENNEFDYNAGFDLSKNITPTLKANLTVNTDFAQVESDKMQVNLTRFSLFYTEKRDFFLEGGDVFKFVVGANNRVFYSRQIGISNFQEVPIIAGARVLGKISPATTIGVFSMQTAKKDSVLTANYSVVRIKQDLFEKSYIGAIFTSKSNCLNNNFVYGLDGLWSISDFLGDKNLKALFSIADSYDKTNNKDKSLSWIVSLSYPNDLFDISLLLSQTQENFNPEIGYIYRTNYKSAGVHLYYSPRWLTDWGIRQFTFKPFDLTYLVTDNTNRLESYSYYFSPLYFVTKYGDLFYVAYTHNFDRVNYSFSIANDKVTIPVGDYYMNTVSAYFSSFTGRSHSVIASYNYGSYYGGEKHSFSFSGSISFLKRCNLTLELEHNWFEYQNCKFGVNVISSNFNIALSTKFNIYIFTQWNSSLNFAAMNFRLHWIPVVGSDVYFIFNDGYNDFKDIKSIGSPTYLKTTGKVVWRFAI